MNNTWFQRYFLPGLIYQSAIVGGAYGSGREITQFFMPFGPVGGLMGMVISMCVFSAVMMATYEFARRFQHFDYRSLIDRLLGPGWLLYELIYVLSLLLIISVLGAVSGELLRDLTGAPEYVGTLGVMALIALLVFYGTKAIERFLSLWSLVLYGAYLVFLGWNLAQNGDAIASNLTSVPNHSGWFGSGIAYAGYNLTMIPALIFCIRHLTCRRDAIVAGLLGGPLVMIPAALFYLAMIGHYDALTAAGDDILPVTYLLNALDGAGFFTVLFPIVLFGTFVETGAAIIHGMNERISHVYEEKGRVMQRWVRPAVAAGLIFTSIVLADTFGLTNLVAQGFGTITYVSLVVFILPMLTWGVWLIYRAGPECRLEK